MSRNGSRNVGFSPHAPRERDLSRRRASRRAPSFELLEDRTTPAFVPVGGEFQVATTVQTLGDGFVATASDADGDFVVTFQLESAANNPEVYARRYNRFGAPQGSDFQVNTFSSGIQAVSDVAMDADGDFVVVWNSQSQDGSSYGIVGQRFNSAGQKAGSEFIVNTTTSNDQKNAKVAMDSQGNFVVVWSGFFQPGGNAYDIYAQRFSAAGARIGSEFMVNQTTSNTQAQPGIAVDADGDFVITWSDYAAGNFDVKARQYNSSGAATTSEFRVNTTTTGGQSGAEVAADPNGNFVVTWVSGDDEIFSQDGSSSGVYAQRFNAAGVAQGSELLVNTYTIGAEGSPSIAMNASGAFTVVFQSQFKDGDNYGVYGRQFSAAGTPQGPEFRVNSTTTQFQGVPDIAMDSLGDFVVVWQGFQFNNTGKVLAQRYEVPQLDTVGVVDGNANWYLRNSNTDGPPDVTPFAFGKSGRTPLVGDWNGDGIDTPGFYNTATGGFQLRNSSSAGTPDIGFVFGSGGTAVPLVGDWDGDGVDTIGLYIPETGEWRLRNSNTAGSADLIFSFGGVGSRIPLVGDWNGDGIDTPGIYRADNSMWRFRNSNTTGVADLGGFVYSSPDKIPVVGDWNGDGKTTIGFFNPANAIWRLRNSLSAGTPDISVQFGSANNTPIVGDWNGRDLTISGFSATQAPLATKIEADLSSAAPLNPVASSQSAPDAVRSSLSRKSADGPVSANFETLASSRKRFVGAAVNRVAILDALFAFGEW